MRRVLPATASKRVAKPPAAETIAICAQPEGNLIWQAVQVIAAVPANTAQRPATSDSTLKPPAAFR